MCTVINDDAYLFTGWLLYAIGQVFKYSQKVGLFKYQHQYLNYCSWGICYNTGVDPKCAEFIGTLTLTHKHTQLYTDVQDSD